MVLVFFDTLLAIVPWTDLVLAAFISVLIGAFWMSPSMFGRSYRRAVARVPRESSPVLQGLVHFIRSLFLASIIALVLHSVHSNGFDMMWWAATSFVAVGICLGLLGEIISRGASLTLWGIISGYIVVSVFVIAAILALQFPL